MGIQRLAKLKFNQHDAYFNSASLGISPPLPPSDNFNWDEAVRVVQEKFGKLIYQPSNNISIFHNTTAGVQRTLLRLSQLFGSSEPTLLLTDLEYPGIVSAVDEEWPGRVIMANLCELIWRGETSQITERFKQCIRMSRPSVVYMSHISRATGYRIDETEIVHFIRSTMPRTVIVIDGAQACGNILVKKELLDEVDVYLTSGHKWLSGKQTLGLVCAADEWRLKDPAQSYSMTSVPTGTGSADVIRSLQRTLMDLNGELTGETSEARMKRIETHNGDLAEYFTRKLSSAGIARHVAQAMNKNPPPRDSTTWRWNGIATVVFDNPHVVIALRQLNNKISFTSLASEKWRDDIGGSPPDKRYCLDPTKLDGNHRIKAFQRANFKEIHVPKLEGYVARFCFHYYHSSDDVDSLIKVIRNAANRVKRSIKTGKGF